MNLTRDTAQGDPRLPEMGGVYKGNKNGQGNRGREKGDTGGSRGDKEENAYRGILDD